MSAQQWQNKVIPAQVAFLAIYNPTLGPSEETFADQLVFYYSHKADEARATKKKSGQRSPDADRRKREDENEKLRRIGFAQGVVDFARTFSGGTPVDSIETGKSRIVLVELETGWWLLASIDLTQLPSAAALPGGKVSNDTKTSLPKPAIDYSSREVSPPALLVSQLHQAHSIFCLHHGPSLSDLFVRLSREKFCNTLDRFWTRFSKTWDVLLHDNPASEIFHGLKLSAGGELGFGVGEEEWGSGERAVLEDLCHRTDGLVDIVVAKFGEALSPRTETNRDSADSDSLLWLGSRKYPAATDGVIFGGTGVLARTSLRDVSLWMQQIYTFGDLAYGIRDNPHRERRKRRKRHMKADEPSFSDNSGDATSTRAEDRSVSSIPTSPYSSRREGTLREQAMKKRAGIIDSAGSVDSKLLPKDERPQLHDRVASQDHESGQVASQAAKHPDIPPPIVTAAEQSLDAALAKADDKVARDQKEQQNDESRDAESGRTLGIPDQYMKYLTFGLSTLSISQGKKPPQERRKSSSSSSQTNSVSNGAVNAMSSNQTSSQKHRIQPSQQMSTLKHMEPMPETDMSQAATARQRRLESEGQFLIGLQGDLDDVPEEGEVTDGSFDDASGGKRTILRTLQVRLAQRQRSFDELTEDKLLGPDTGSNVPMPGSTAAKNFKRLRAVLYVRRPFMFCFLFEQHTESLSYSKFYKDLHKSLAPIHKPLIASTSVGVILERIEESQNRSHGMKDPDKSKPASKDSATRPIFDLIYDPQLLTVHTSIPNIPEPGSLAAEGILVPGKDDESPRLTRLDAINVHSQVLNTLASTKRSTGEFERTSKTSRGWWVVWMKLPPSPSTDARREDDPSSNSTIAGYDSVDLTPSRTPDTPGASTQVPPSLVEQPDMSRIAFLVRKASDSTTQSKSSGGIRSASGMLASLSWGRSVEDGTGGAGAGWGPAALAGGIGVDARRYVEGLLSLNR